MIGGAIGDYVILENTLIDQLNPPPLGLQVILPPEPGSVRAGDFGEHQVKFIDNPLQTRNVNVGIRFTQQLFELLAALVHRGSPIG
jgi:hypothetical protein